MESTQAIPIQIVLERLDESVWYSDIEGCLMCENYTKKIARETLTLFVFAWEAA